MSMQPSSESGHTSSRMPVLVSQKAISLVTLEISPLGIMKDLTFLLLNGGLYSY